MEQAGWWQAPDGRWYPPPQTPPPPLPPQPPWLRVPAPRTARRRRWWPVPVAVVVIGAAIAVLVVATSGSGPQSGRFGHELVLRGAPGEKAAVTARLVDPGTADGAWRSTPPDAGTRYVGVALLIRNTGSAPIPTTDTGDGELDGGEIQQVPRTVAGCPTLDVAIPPGATGSDCEVFEVAVGQRVGSFDWHFSWDGSPSGTWN